MYIPFIDWKSTNMFTATMKLSVPLPLNFLHPWIRLFLFNCLCVYYQRPIWNDPFNLAFVFINWNSICVYSSIPISFPTFCVFLYSLNQFFMYIVYMYFLYPVFFSININFYKQFHHILWHITNQCIVIHVNHIPLIFSRI